jgi:predicted lipoprotein with Yx(FWY)xxD motif
MKRIALGLAALAMTSGVALADDPAKVMDSASGKIWTDANGMALYTFDKDAAGVTNCYEDCAKNWPPLMAAADAKPMGEWTVVERKDGTKMWAYEGHPLYTFIGDKAAGEVAGDGKGEVWHVAKAD